MHPGSSGTSATKDSSSSLQKMMISYLFSTLALSKIISKNGPANLFHLIRLRLGAIALKIDLFLNASFIEHVMASSSSFHKAER